MTPRSQPLLLSLKPRYADLIFRRDKLAELRRRIAPDMDNRDVYVYVSSPVCALRGGFRVERVWDGTPEEVWNSVRQYVGMDKRDYDAYYAGSRMAWALKIADVWEYRKPVKLERLRTRFPGFVAPQSWRYATAEERRSFRNMARLETDAVLDPVSTDAKPSGPRASFAPLSAGGASGKAQVAQAVAHR